jgi:hypothetical protein
MAILEDQISISAGREDPREVPARPAHVGLKQTTVARVLAPFNGSLGQRRRRVLALIEALVVPLNRKPAIRRFRRFFVWLLATHDDRDLSFQDRKRRD